MVAEQVHTLARMAGRGQGQNLGAINPMPVVAFLLNTLKRRKNIFDRLDLDKVQVQRKLPDRMKLVVAFHREEQDMWGKKNK